MTLITKMMINITKNLHIPRSNKSKSRRAYTTKMTFQHILFRIKYDAITTGVSFRIDAAVFCLAPGIVLTNFIHADLLVN